MHGSSASLPADLSVGVQCRAVLGVGSDDVPAGVTFDATAAASAATMRYMVSLCFSARVCGVRNPTNVLEVSYKLTIYTEGVVTHRIVPN